MIAAEAGLAPSGAAGRVRHLLHRLWADPAVRQALVLVLALRVALGAVGLIILTVAPGDPSHATLPGELLPRSSPWWWLVAPWQRDDALWYQRIAEHGYSAHGADTAFFPLYPALSAATAAIIRAPVAVAQLLVSTLALVAGLVCVRRIVETDHGAAVARRTALYIALAPTAFFLVAPFTEGLFLALSAGAILAARRRRLLLAGCVAAAAAVCRAQGVILALPLAVEAASAWRERRAAGERADVVRSVLAVVLPVVAAAAFSAGMVASGHGGPATAQSFWYKHVAPPWTVISDSVAAVLRGTHPEEMYNLAAAALLVLAIPLMARRLRPSLTVYTAASILPLLAQENGLTPLMSVARFAVVVFPAFALLAMAGRRRSVHRFLCLVSPLLMLAAFADFTRFHFIG